MCEEDQFYLCLFLGMFWKPLPVSHLVFLFQEAIKFGGENFIQEFLIPSSHFTDEITDILKIYFETKSHRIQKSRIKGIC